MKSFLNDIQTDLVRIAAELGAGLVEEAKQEIHYLHAYIENRKMDLEAEAVPNEAGQELVNK